MQGCIGPGIWRAFARNCTLQAQHLNLPKTAWKGKAELLREKSQGKKSRYRTFRGPRVVADDVIDGGKTVHTTAKASSGLHNISFIEGLLNVIRTAYLEICLMEAECSSTDSLHGIVHDQGFEDSA